MSRTFRVAILSDVHYAGALERAVGDDYEHRVIENSALRFLLRQYRRFIWLRYPLRQNGQLDRFLAAVPLVDLAVANGDFSCNTAAIGISDPAAFESAAECIAKLRATFSDRLRLTFGDHELGKLRLLGSRGGLRLHSWQRGVEELNIPPFWKVELGRYVLIGCTSTLIALPLFPADQLAEECAEWERLREGQLTAIRQLFASLHPEQRVLLFCHDPSALPFLWRDEVVRSKVNQIERTVVGHLHSNLYLRATRLLSGMPELRFLGHSMRRMSAAVREARTWRPFRVMLCPSLAGIELLNDGGYFVADLPDAPSARVGFKFYSLPRPRWE